jgi:hypothetical protein
MTSTLYVEARFAATSTLGDKQTEIRSQNPVLEAGPALGLISDF